MRCGGVFTLEKIEAMEKQFKSLQDKPVYGTRTEWYCGPFEPKVLEQIYSGEIHCPSCGRVNFHKRPAAPAVASGPDNSEAREGA